MVPNYEHCPIKILQQIYYRSPPNWAADLTGPPIYYMAPSKISIQHIIMR